MQRSQSDVGFLLILNHRSSPVKVIMAQPCQKLFPLCTFANYYQPNEVLPGQRVLSSMEPDPTSHEDEADLAGLQLCCNAPVVQVEVQISVSDTELEVLQELCGVFKNVQRVEDVKPEIACLDESIVHQLLDGGDCACRVKPAKPCTVSRKS